jgi:hypothetical protein
MNMLQQVKSPENRWRVRVATPPYATVFPADAVALILLRYAAPQDVLRDPALSQSEKRDVLRRWALDAYVTESAPSEHAKPDSWHLDEVIDALIALDEPELRRFIERAR